MVLVQKGWTRSTPSGNIQAVHPERRRTSMRFGSNNTKSENHPGARIVRSTGRAAADGSYLMVRRSVPMGYTLSKELCTRLVRSVLSCCQLGTYNIFIYIYIYISI